MKRKIKKTEIEKILKLHEDFLYKECGKSADFSGINLQCSDFGCENLMCADFHEADLRLSNLSGANLQRVNFRKADFN